MKAFGVEANGKELIGLGAVALGLLFVAGWGVGKAAGAVAEFVADPKNPVNRTAEATYQAVTGSTGTPGGDLYAATHDPVTGAPTFWGKILDAAAGVSDIVNDSVEFNARVTGPTAAPSDSGTFWPW